MTPLCRTSLRHVLILLLLSAFSLRAEHAAAKTFGESVRALGADLRSMEQAIGELGASDDPRALPVLEALVDKRLEVDEEGKLLIRDGARTVSAETGEAATPSGKVRTPVVNNVVRRALGPALATLRLSSEDSAVRLKAVEELAKRSGPETARLLKKTLESETDDSLRNALQSFIVQMDLDSEDPLKRVAAIEMLSSSGNLAMKGALQALLERDGDGAFREPDDRVRAAAQSAVLSLERREMFTSLVASLFHGLSLGSVLLLAALGLAITFGLMRVINMAHGEMLMLGAYSTFVVQNLFQTHLPSAVDWYLPAAIPVAFAVCVLTGIALERSVIRFLYGRPLETLLATWGISLLLIQTVRLIFGAQNVTVANPTWLSGGFELLPSVVLPYSRIAVIVFVVLVATFIWALLQRTPLGLKVRAVTQNREMAAGMGISTRQVDMWTFGLGSGIAGLGGVALSQLGNVGPELGQSYIVDSFLVVVLGGVGKLAGTVAGAMGLGLLNKLLEPLTGAVMGKILLLAFVILFIQKRPQGIFALKGRAAEAA